MDFELSQEQTAMQDSIRKFIEQEKFLELAPEWDKSGTFPHDIYHRLASAGWCSMAIPQKYGGMGGSILDLSLVTEELARGDLSFATIYMNSQYSGAHTILNHGSEHQRRTLLPKIADGSIRFAFGFTEPDGGTDILGHLKTRAVRVGGGFNISGAKIYTTGAEFCDYILLLARTDPTPMKPSLGISLFIVPIDSPGLEVKRLDTLGIKATGTTQTFYTDVFVPDEAVVGDVGQGFYQLLGSLNNERILVASMSLGVAQHALDDAVAYANNRFSFGKSIGSFQSIQHNLARSSMRIEAARLLTRQAAWKQDRGLPCKAEAAMCKVMASEAAWDTALHGTRLMGGAGFTMEYSMQRYLRDSWAMMNGPVTTEQALNIIGETLGLEKSY